jgi:hypothetical protein
MESVSVPSCGDYLCVRLIRRDGRGEQAYHVKEGCVCEEGGGPVYTSMDVEFEVVSRGRRGGDADDGLHDSIKMEEIRPANSLSRR